MSQDIGEGKRKPYTPPRLREIKREINIPPSYAIALGLDPELVSPAELAAACARVVQSIESPQEKEEPKMKTFMHADAHSEKDCPCIAVATEEFRVRWPSIPWKCTSCKHVFSSHAQTVAVVDEEFLKRARVMVAAGKKRLAAGVNMNGIQLQESEIAETRVTVDLAEQALAHPAKFLCSTCLIDAVTTAHDAADKVIEKVIHVDMGNRDTRKVLFDLLRAVSPAAGDSEARGA
jgi:hypothetical protein